VHATFREVVQGSEARAEERANRVLVADDDPAIRRLIMAALKRDGYGFLEASNGREALDLMRSQHPDIVVLDLMMPVVSGWDVLQERLSDPALSKIPVIIVSANREPELVHAIDKGICAFLPKPFDIAALSALVRACVARE
jgi:CheY-like chemotaxis protein